MSSSFPRITVITPSFNQSAFLEKTICSVLDQGYPNLKYIIIDGGSTDGSVDVIKRYQDRLAYWESGPDSGQSNAINKGLKRATGDWVCWQNSDDVFYPFSFELVAKAISKNPDLDFIIGDINLIDENGRLIRPMCYVKPTYQSLLVEGMVLTNQAAFWRRSLHHQIDFLNEDMHYGFDYEWFLRLLKFTHNSCHIPAFLGALRLHSNTKTSLNQPGFAKEYAAILDGRQPSKFLKYFYLLRRTILTLANFKFSYVLNGLKSRVVSHFKNKFVSK